MRTNLSDEKNYWGSLLSYLGYKYKNLHINKIAIRTSTNIVITITKIIRSVSIINYVFIYSRIITIQNYISSCLSFFKLKTHNVTTNQPSHYCNFNLSDPEVHSISAFLNSAVQQLHNACLWLIQTSPLLTNNAMLLQ